MKTNDGAQRRRRPTHAYENYRMQHRAHKQMQKSHTWSYAWSYALWHDHRQYHNTMFISNRKIIWMLIDLYICNITVHIKC